MLLILDDFFSCKMMHMQEHSCSAFLFSEKYKGQRMQMEKAQHDLRSNIKSEFKGNKHVQL